MIFTDPTGYSYDYHKGDEQDIAGIILDGWIPNPVEFLMDGIMKGIGRNSGHAMM